MLSTPSALQQEWTVRKFVTDSVGADRDVFSAA